ncbi:MAG: flagellar hook-length control protein FliK [Rhodomicrobium sp.]
MARDTASHGSASSGAAPTPAEAPRSFEVSSAIELASVGASAAPLAQQILVGIQRAIPAADNSETSPGALQPTLDGQQQPLKTITIALSPASLGNVAVELSLNSGRLGVKLQVEEPATVQLLRQDGSLEKLLESAGYAVQSLSIHLSPQPNQLIQGQTTPNGQGFSNQFSPAGGGQEQGHSQSHKGQPEDRNADQKPGYGRAEDVRGGSLYV